MFLPLLHHFPLSKSVRALHCRPPPPGSEEQCLSEALTTVFSMLHQALRVYYSCGRADKTAYKIITKMIGGAGGQSCTDGCRKPILVGLT